MRFENRCYCPASGNVETNRGSPKGRPRCKGVDLESLKCLKCGKEVKHWFETNACNDCNKDKINENFNIKSGVFIKTPKGMGGFQYHVDKPRPLDECKRDISLLEQSGKMGKNEQRSAKIRLAGLQRDQDRGVLDNSVDYQVVGHPMERD